MTFLTYQLLPLNQTIFVLAQGLKPFSICQETAKSRRDYDLLEVVPSHQIHVL